MAQGFVTNLNLTESDTVISDRNALDNLGGIGLSNDIQLFIGNARFKSALINDPDFLADSATDYGQFEVGKRYRVTNIGEAIDPRNWVAVGGASLSTVDVGTAFTAIASGAGEGGTGGSALEIIGRTDFSSSFIDGQGWTAFVNVSTGKTAFTEDTPISFDKGVTYQHKIFNSDGIRRFQIKHMFTDAIFNLEDVSNMTLTRNDEVTLSNLKNFYVARSSTDFDEVGRPDIAQPFDRIGSVKSNLSGFTAKKNNTILTYEPDTFENEGTEGGIIFDGSVRIKNKGDHDGTNGHPVSIGNPTPFGQLVIGEPYEVAHVGNVTQDQWRQVGISDILPSTPEVTTGSLEIGKVYRIESIGVANIGTNGNFTFSHNDIDGTDPRTYEIDMGSNHGLVVDDKLLYLENGAGANSISGLDDQGVYYVQSVNGDKIKLASTAGAGAEGVIQIAPEGTGIHNEFIFTVDPQNRWNAIGGTTGIDYIQTNEQTNTSGTIFKATSNGSTISGGKIKLARFNASARVYGNIPVSNNGLATALEAPGLYILNPADDRAIRAFTDPTNPWNEVSATIGALNVVGLKTESNLSQSQNFVFKRKFSTPWGSFIAGEKYTVTDTGNRNWGNVGHDDASPAVGSTFIASASGPSGGSGGFALGSPKILFTNDAQNSVDNGAFQQVASGSTYGADLIADYTHTIPVVINGETYFLLAKADNGIYKPDDSNYSESTHSGVDSDGSGSYRILVLP